MDINIVQGRAFKIFEYIVLINRCTIIGVTEGKNKEGEHNDIFYLSLQDGPRMTTIPCDSKKQAEDIHAWLEDRLVQPDDICPI